MTTTRREFAKVVALTGAGLAVVGPEVFASSRLRPPTFDHFPLPGDPMPINEGPAPLWQDFKYIVRPYDCPHQFSSSIDGVSDFGWHAWYEGEEYGDYVCIDKDAATVPEVIMDVKQLLKEQADIVRHQLIKNAKLPCFCTMCKAEALMFPWSEMSPDKTRYSLYAQFPHQKGMGETTPIQVGWTVPIRGKGRGWVRAAHMECDRNLTRMVKHIIGPTNGYPA